MSGLSYFQTDRIPGDIQTWKTLYKSITELEAAYVTLVEKHQRSSGAEKDKTVARLRTARLAIWFFREMLNALRGILRIATGAQHTQSWDMYFQTLSAPRTFMPNDSPSAFEKDNRAHSSVINSIGSVALMMAQALEDREILTWKLPRGQRGYGVGNFLNATQHRLNLVNDERHKTTFEDDIGRLETARYNIVIHDQNVMSDEFEDLKDAQSRDSFGIGLKTVTRAANILIRVAREIERPNY